jgi:hypothetical protein
LKPQTLQSQTLEPESQLDRNLKRLYVDPPTLLKWLPKGKRNEIVFLELEPDFLDDETIRFDLNIVFRPIPIRRGTLSTRDCYVGSTGARIVFEAFLGTVKRYTPGATLKVDYENSYKRLRSAAVKLAPNVEVSEAKVNIGEIAFTKDAERTFITRFSGSERTLSEAFFGNGVEWELALPEGKQAVRDYLIGNLFLYVEASWNAQVKEGMIEVRPSDVVFFDSERRLIAEGIKAVAMRWALYREGIKLKRDSIVVNFKEQ